ACSQCEAPNTPEDSDPNLVRSVLRDYRVKYVLLLRFTPDGHNVYATEAPWLAVQAYLRDVAGFRLVDEDADRMLYLYCVIKEQCNVPHRVYDAVTPARLAMPAHTNRSSDRSLRSATRRQAATRT